MRMINKILFSVMTSILAVIFVVLIYFGTYADVTPSPSVVNYYMQKIDVIPFKGIKAYKGKLEIQITQSDTCSLNVFSGDQIIEKYLVAEVKDNLLILDIKDDFKHFEMAKALISIKMPDLKEIKLHEHSELSLKKFNTEKLDVQLSGNSSLVIDSCRIAYLNIRCKDISEVFSENTHIDSVEYSISNNSGVKITENVKMYSGEVFNNGYINIAGKELYSSDPAIGYKKISELIPELSFIWNKKDLTNLLTGQYGAQLFDFDERVFSDDKISNLNRILGINQISFDGGEILGENVEAWNFFYKKGKLQGYSMVFPSDDADVPGRLKIKLTKMLGESKEGLTESYTVSSMGLHREKAYYWTKEIDSLQSIKIIELFTRNGTTSVREYLVPQINHLYDSFSAVTIYIRNIRKEQLFESIFKTVQGQNTEPLESLLKPRIY